MMQGGGGSNGMIMQGINHGAMKQGGNMEGMMGGMDLNDIAYDAFLANDRTLDNPEIVKVENGGRVRLRIINGATSTGFTIDLGSLTGELVAVDGQPIRPISGRQFPLSMAQRADIRLALPKGGGAFPILALREGASEQTGIILATSRAEVGIVCNFWPVRQDRCSTLDLEAQLQAEKPLAERAPDRRFRCISRAT